MNSRDEIYVHRNNIFYMNLFTFLFPTQLLIAVIINWIICGILTHTGMLTDDPASAEYTTRTDARGSVVQDSSWFNIPYPGNIKPLMTLLLTD